MERKIGEIFEYNGEWYQCVEGNWCRRCDLHKSNLSASQCDKRYYCLASKRKDRTSVIFKKLEKVGEPYNIGKKVFQRYRVFIKPYIFNDEFFTINTPV